MARIDNIAEKQSIGLAPGSVNVSSADAARLKVLKTTKVANPIFNHERIKFLNLPKTKRVLDVLGALLAIALLSPVILIIALIAKVLHGSPVIFKQPRPGKDGKLFMIYKFRSMTHRVDSNGNLLADAERLTVFGRFLRATSLDELPELFNVLCGEMSFVGPRPLIEEYLPLYTETQKRRHEVRPGLTGWAQVNGRNMLSWEEKFKFDVWYVDNWDLLLDFKILLLTVKKVITGEGIQAENHVTMPKFKGSKG